jgi:hypothetical protein
MNPGHRQSSFPARTISARWLWLARVWFAVRRAWRHFRITRWPTRLLGPQYRRSRTLLELDITYACNLHCYNCNRSVRQAPEALHLPVEKLRVWVDEWITRGKRWQRIRVLGGEPTLHPQFREIIAELLRYRAWSPQTLIEVVTNGHGTEVAARLKELPPDVWVENSRKQSVVQPTFGPFNLAPADDPAYEHADFTNGCAIMRDCGMGLTPLGYYPCAIAGGIDRVTGDGVGSQRLPDDGDDMLPMTSKFCRLCGRFRDGHFVPHSLRPALTEEKISPTWRDLYARWRERRRAGGEKP